MKAEGQPKKGCVLCNQVIYLAKMQRSKTLKKGNYADMYITFRSVFKYIRKMVLIDTYRLRLKTLTHRRQGFVS